MTTLYVSSVDGDDGAPPSVSWWNGNQPTYESIQGAIAALSGAGPHHIYVDSEHDFVKTSAIDWSCNAASQRLSIVSTNRSTGAPLAGATESITPGADVTGEFTIQTNAAATDSRLYLSGLHAFGNDRNISGSNVSFCRGAATNSRWNLEAVDCLFVSRSLHATSGLLFFGQSLGINARFVSNIRLIRTELRLKNNTGTALEIAGCQFEASGLSISYSGATKPTVLVTFHANVWCVARIFDSDLSGFNSGNYFDVSSLSGYGVELVNVKLHPTPGLVTGTWLGTSAGSLTLVNVDSGDTRTAFEYRNRLGTLTESESIYRNSGAELYFASGDTVPVSWQVVTTAACNEHEPFALPWLVGRAEGTTQINVDIEFVHDSATALHDRNVWSEVDFISSATHPLGTLHSSRNAEPFTGTGANHGASSATWTGTGGMTNENKQRTRNTVTPAEKCTLRGRLVVGVASKTLYVNPALVVA